MPAADVADVGHHSPGRAPTANSGDLLEHVISWGLRGGMLHSGDHVVLVAGLGLGSGSHNMVRVHRVA